MNTIYLLLKSLALWVFGISECKCKSKLIRAEAINQGERCEACIVSNRSIGKSRLCTEFCRSDDQKFFTTLRPAMDIRSDVEEASGRC